MKSEYEIKISSFVEKENILKSLLSEGYIVSSKKEDKEWVISIYGKANQAEKAIYKILEETEKKTTDGFKIDPNHKWVVTNAVTNMDDSDILTNKEPDLFTILNYIMGDSNPKK